MAKQKMYQRPDGLYEKGVTINGKRIRFRGKTEREVLQKIAAYEEKQNNGRTFKEVAEDWLPHYETQVSYNTYYKQMAHYNRVINFFGDLYVKDITPQDVSRFYLLMQSQKYSKKTIEHSRTTLSNILRYALVNGEIKALPSENVPIPKHLKPKENFLPTTNCGQSISTQEHLISLCSLSSSFAPDADVVKLSLCNTKTLISKTRK